jgi:hypothetical protein
MHGKLAKKVGIPLVLLLLAWGQVWAINPLQPGYGPSPGTDGAGPRDTDPDDFPIRMGNEPTVVFDLPVRDAGTAQVFLRVLFLAAARLPL